MMLLMQSQEKNQNTNNINTLLSGAEDPQAFDALFQATFHELRSLARGLMNAERPNHTLQPTALVNEAFLKLFDAERIAHGGKTHFLNLAAKVMRRILIDHARRKNTAKRGGGWYTVTLTDHCVGDFQNDIDLLDLNLALERLAEIDPRATSVVEMRVFGGLGMAEIAQANGTTRRTAHSDWRIATMWLRREFSRL